MYDEIQKTARRSRKRGKRRTCGAYFCALLAVVSLSAIAIATIGGMKTSQPVKDVSAIGFEEWTGNENQGYYSIAPGDIDLIDAEASATDRSAWNLILVNPWNRLSDDFSVRTVDVGGGQSVDRRVYSDLSKMLDDARAEGLSPIVCSSYRTAEKQADLFERQIRKFIAQGYSEKDAKAEAAKWVAVPGTSEHQTGLAIDMVALSYQNLDEGQENTAEQKWLMQNAHRYGFILRYPSDKSEITGIGYEPWHYRYVGKEAAQTIYEKGICLEEYLDNC